MRNALLTAALAAAFLAVAAVPAHSQLLVMDKATLIEFTRQNPFDRFADGRPKVPDSILERMREMSAEEAWGILQNAGYKYQYEGNFHVLHPEKKLIGRAVTAQFMPVRPDVNQVIDDKAKAAGLAKSQNERVIELLQPGDVVVVDLFGKIEDGTFVGDNLATAVYTQSRTGMVIDGGIRDLDGIFPIPMAAYFRGAHPTYLRDVMLTGINIPIHIGNATVMPGDVVFGDREGVVFIPPQMVQKIVEQSEKTRQHDEFTQMKIKENKRRIRDVYPLNEELQKEYEEWQKKQAKP